VDYKKLEKIVGKHNISCDIYDRISYAVDPLPFDLKKRNIPDYVLKPSSAKQVSKILKFANVRKKPVVIHGGGTSFIGASRPKRKGTILISMTNFNEKVLNEQSMYFECGAGCNVNEVEVFLKEHGYMFPANLGSKLAATMGGLVSINTIGHMVDGPVGKPLDYLMGVEVVLPTGEIIDTGTKSLRRPSGLDLTRIFAGTEGLFGVITKIRMRLIEDPKKAHVAAYFKTPEEIAKAFIKVYQEKAPIPLYGEFLDEPAAKIGYKLRGLPPPKGAVALCSSTGRTEEEACRNAKMLLNIFKQCGAIESEVIDEDLQQKMWGARDAILQLVREQRGNWVAIEVSPELPHLVDVVKELKCASNKLRVLKNNYIFLYGHIGACSIHALWIIPSNWSDSKKRRALKEVLTLEKEMNVKYGGCGGELGQMAGRVPFFKKKYGVAGYNVLKRVKQALDPNNILNPGNLEGEI
jgi:glycolate oxidase